METDISLFVIEQLREQGYESVTKIAHVHPEIGDETGKAYVVNVEAALTNIDEKRALGDVFRSMKQTYQTEQGIDLQFRQYAQHGYDSRLIPKK